MSGKLPRSTQIGKKIAFPKKISPPDRILNTKMTVNSVNVEPGRLSPFLGHSVILEEDSFYDSSTSPQNENHQADYSTYLKEDTTISSLSDIESWGNSSSSSMSWYDDYDTDAMRILSKELDNIELVLYGEAHFTILKKEFQEECKEWMDAFPHLSVKGTSLKSEFPSISNWKIQSSLNAYFSLSENQSSGNQTYRVATPKYSGQQSRKYRNPRIRSGGEHNVPSIRFGNVRQITDTGSCLRISPAPQYEAPLKFSAGQKKNAATLLIRSEVSSSKWHRQGSPEFSSLPYIPSFGSSTQNSVHRGNLRPTIENLEFIGHKNSEPIQALNKKTTLLSAKNARQEYYQTLPNRQKPLILPPIEQLKISTSNPNFRSISATPRKSAGLLKNSVENSSNHFLVFPKGNFFDKNLKEDTRNRKGKSHYK